MNTWILTIGNSDVQLNTDNNWSKLYGKVRSEIPNRIRFKPAKPVDAPKDPYTVAARALGIVYGNQLEDYYENFVFPLLNNFVNKLQQESISPERIILVFTDQEDSFDKTRKEQDKKCPYWQDTCTLKPIIVKYLQQENKFPQASLDYVYLKPNSQDKGLDNWDATLELVESAFLSENNSQIERTFTLKELAESETIYVSHQAGTPALSSAIQSVTLGEFRGKVKFLVSNEYNQSLTKIIPSSRYLRRIAQEILERYDYPGVKEILSPPSEEVADIFTLLDAAMEWNQAQFSKFVKKLESYPGEIGETARKLSQESWSWWSAYESAYLGVVRLEQGNTVEAFFHSFRSVEGLMKKYIEKHYSNYIQGRDLRHPDDKKKYNFYGKGLYLFLRHRFSLKENQVEHKDLWVFGETTFDERNTKFHQLEGIGKQDVFQAWRTEDKETWQQRVLGCINFIAQKKFASLEEASLIAKVHKELQAKLNS